MDICDTREGFVGRAGRPIFFYEDRQCSFLRVAELRLAACEWLRVGASTSGEYMLTSSV